MKKLSIFITIGILSFLEISCKHKPIELDVPKNQFNVHINNNGAPADSLIEGGIEIYTADYEATYCSRYYKASYLLRTYKNGITLIRYPRWFENEYETLILIYNFKGGNNALAAFIRWQDGNVSLKGYEEHPRIWKMPSALDIEINESTEYLETNLDSMLVKKMYPKLRCKITNKCYREISIPFGERVQTLAFFWHIAFIG
jgi:hypothetical protein